MIDSGYAHLAGKAVATYSRMFVLPIVHWWTLSHENRLSVSR